MEQIASNIHRKVKNQFIWTSDKIIHPDYYDHWQSYPDEIERGEVIRDDCDAFALTCAELAYRNIEVQKRDIKIIFCKVETGESHLVSALDHWIMDNRQREVWTWEDIPYKWISSMRLDEPGIWRSMKS